MRELQADPVLWENFRRLPELYKRVRIDTIQIKRNRPELFRKRLDKFWKTPAGESSTANGTTTAGYGREILRWSRLD